MTGPMALPAPVQAPTALSVYTIDIPQPAANPDALKLCMAVGAAAFYSGEHVYKQVDNGATWLELVSEDEGAKRLKFNVQHIVWVGTIPEMVAQFEQQLRTIVDVFTNSPEFDLSKQTDALNRAGFTSFRSLPSVDPQALQKIELAEQRQTGFESRQHSYDRSKLKRMVAEWSNRRFVSPNELIVDAPTDDPAAIDSLLAALQLLRSDRVAKDSQREKNKTLATAT